MRKFFLCLLMSLIGMFCSVEAQTIALSDGFESGNLDKWTQEAVVGNTAWDVEVAGPDLAYPSTVLQGTHRAYLRNNTGETQGYVTRLISPVMRLDTVYQPMLSFWYANPKWTADRDTLRVLYKTGEKANWKELLVFSDAKANWQKVTIDLPEITATYQIAFEGKDNLGRGIVLDSVLVRSTPECTVPHDIMVNSQGAGKVNIAWTASWDANQFEMIISKSIINPDTIDRIDPASGIIAFHELIPGTQQNYDLDLVSGEYYYPYIRSICEGEISTWGTAAQFRVKATKTIPYNYSFNLPYDPDHAWKDLEWTWKNNMGNFSPFIDTYLSVEDRAKYSQNGTFCAVFTGATNVTTPIPGGKYAYLATPAITDSADIQNFALNKCQVSFWTTVYTYTGRKYAHSIIVGAMTDPEDFTTFVPVDTISIWGTKTFQENVVDFSSYQGDGNYVAFVSDFETQNIIFLDEVSIRYKPTVQKVTKVSVNPRDTYANISWEGNAPAYNVLITNEDVDPTKAKPEEIVAQATVTTNSYLCSVLEEDHSWDRPYYVFVQAVNGENTAEWSYRYPFVTIASQNEMPYSFDFEQKSGKIYNIGTVFYPTKMGIFSNDPEYPHLNTSGYYKGSSCLYLTKDPGNDSWITLPIVDNLQNKPVDFYLNASSTPAQGHATIGVMTNPMDINTFTPVADFTITSTTYTRCYANFAEYTGDDGVIAIVWTDVDGMAKNTINYIDELTIDTIAKCLPPFDIKAIAESQDSITLTWKKAEANAWEFVFAKGELLESQQAKTLEEIAQLDHVLFVDTLYWNDPLADPTFGIDSLQASTTYYMYVRTLCGTETTWWVSAVTKTPCLEAFPFPFKEDFNRYPSSAKAVDCWQFGEYGSSTGYPMTYAPSSGAQDGTMLELWSTSTTHRNVVIMPAVDAEFSQMLLQLDARPYGTTSTCRLFVGSMGDIADWTTFVPVDSFTINGGNEFFKVRMDLADYNFVHGNIAFSSGLTDPTVSLTSSDLLIDNVELKPNTCVDVYNFKQTEQEPNSIGFTWDGKSKDDQWEIKVLKEYAKLDSNIIAPYDTAKVAIINDSIITGKSFRVEDLEILHKYYIYIRTLCGDSLWYVDSLKTGCVKINPNKPNKETFESYDTGAGNVPDCWTVGNGYGPSAGTGNIPYVYSGSTYASSGTKVLRLNETSTQNPDYAVSPEIDTQDMSELLVSFTFYASTSYWGVWGVMSDPTDLSTFVALDSLKGTAAKVSVALDLKEYAELIPSTARYFAWRGRYSAADLFYIDDVSIITLKCVITKPSTSNVMAESARISSGLLTDNDWVLLVTDSLISTDSLAVEGFVIPDTNLVFYDTIIARSMTITNLKEQTDYYVYTASLCDDDMSPWSTTTFRTPCKAITPEALGTITFSKNDGYVSGTSASRYMPCWTVGNKSGNASATSSYIPYVNTTSSYLFGPQKDSILYIYAYVPTSATSTAYDGAYAIMPELDVDDISKYQVNFYARTTSSTGATYHDELIVGVVTDPSDLNTFVAVDTVKLSHTAYEAFTISFEDYQGDYLGRKGRYIMFLGECGTPTYFYAYIASISVNKIPTCRAVTAFNVDSVAEDAAMISWRQYSDSYRLMVANEIVADDEKDTYDKWLIDSLVSKTDSVLISGLAPSTQYYAYAQAMCEGGDSSAISMTYAFFTTLCPENGFTVPYKQDFEKYATNAKVVDCWQFEDYLASTKTYPEVMNPTTGAVSGKQLELWSTSAHNCVAIMPKIQGNLADYMLSFDARSYGVSSKSVLYIGTMDDVLDSVAGFAPFDTLYMDGGNEFYHKDLVLADYADKLIHSRIAFTSGLGTTLEMTSDMYLDNVKIGMPPTCFAPTLEAGYTTMYEAEINITPARPGNDLWHLVLIPDSIYSKMKQDSIDLYLDTTTNYIVADSVHYVVSGLHPGTEYKVFGRTICGGDDGNSEWTTRPIATRTKYYYKDSYFFGFEKDEGWDYCQGSTSASYYLHPALEVGYNGGSATTSYTTYYPYCMESSSSAVYSWGNKPASGVATDPWPDGKGVLRWYATSSYWGGYIVFPSVAEPKARSFEFNVRNCYLTFSTMKASTPNENLILEVGTIDKNKGYETYEVLATIRMPKTDNTIVATESNNYLFKAYTIDLDSATVADKRIVLRTPQQEPSISVYPYIDNVKLDTLKGFGLVSIKQVKAGPDSAAIIWDNQGGPWNLYITHYDSKTKKTDTVASYLDLMDITSVVVRGLTPQTSYTAILKAVNAPAGTKFETTSSKAFTTPCLAIQPDANGEFFWNFNDRSEWERSDVLVGGTATNTTDTCYWKPECWKTGTTYTGSQSTSTVYYNWLIQRVGYSYTGAPTGNPSSTYLKYEYGRNNTPALRLFTSTSYMTPYIVMPELNCSLDTMMIEFYARCFANYAEDHATVGNRNKIISTSYLGSTYTQSIIIGTLTDPSDFSTLEVIDTLSYKQTGLTTSNLVNADPAGLRYWEKMQLPLAGTSGKYIVLFMPKEKAGLFFVDDVSVKPVGDNIFVPTHPKTVSVTTTSAHVTWDVKHPTLQSVVVLLDQNDTEIFRDSIVGTEYTFTNLEPGSVYTWYVYQTNGTINSSQTEAITFDTECLPVKSNYRTGFELSDGWKIVPGQTSITYKQPTCWISTNAGTAAWSSSYEGYNQLNTSTIQYSHNGEYALRIEGYSTTHQPYMVMPAIEDVAAYDTLQLNFWMRPGYHNPTTGKITTQYTVGSTASTAEYYYSKAIIVGTMTDPYDAATFVPIDTINYNGTIAVGDDANAGNEYLFQKKKVILAGATGRYVAFMTTLYAKGETRKSTYDYMWLDDVSFSKVQQCDAPEGLKASEVGAYSAQLSWDAPEGADKYLLQVSTDLYYAEDTAFVFNDTVEANTYKVENLEGFTEYYWRVRTICGEDLGESEFSMNNTFTTAHIPFYGENFSSTALEAGWSFGTTPAIEVIDSTDVEITGSNNSTYGFKRVTTNYGISGAHYTVPCYTSSSTTTTYRYYWMISPVVYLNEKDSALFTMDFALTSTSSSTPAAAAATEANMADDYTFLIIISDDGGKTWKQENIVGLWNNQMPKGWQLRDIPSTATNLRVDLSKYAGKNIRVAFYREAFTYISNNCAFHIGNIRINNYHMRVAEANPCQFEDVVSNGFSIDGDKVSAGEHTYTRVAKATDIQAKQGVNDSIYVLNLDVKEAPITVFEDTICYGESYSSHDFSGKTVSGVYRRKLQAVDGCDSIAELHLFVRPELVTNLEASICQGDTLKFDDKFIGQVLNRQGVYFDTISASTGCDSVLILSLTVLQPATSEFSARACETTGYYWEAVAKTFTQSGDFTEKLQTVEGCDSTVTLHLTIFKKVEDATEAEIEKGDAYSFYGETYTESGTYTVVVPGQDGECDSTHVLVLTVKTALEKVENGNLKLLPNIIRAGESVTAKGQFSGNVHVEVYDIVGRMILSEDQKATHNRIEISAFDNAGVYTVRISDKLNTQFVGRVIVQ